jgi:Family of unknown function (DUF6364)
MTTKLTLSVSAKTITKAKKYARKNGTSVSKIFEDHISSITERDKYEKGDPLESLKKLKGIAKNLSTEVSYDDLITNAIIEKYLK